MNFKKMLALLCALMLCIPAAFAQTVQVEGEIAVTGYDTLTGEITALYDETHASIPATPHPGMRFYAQLSIPAKAGDILRGDSE